MPLGHRTDFAIRRHLLQMIQREYDIHVLLKAAAVEIDADVALGQLAVVEIDRQYAVIG